MRASLTEISDHIKKKFLLFKLCHFCSFSDEHSTKAHVFTKAQIFGIVISYSKLGKFDYNFHLKKNIEK